MNILKLSILIFVCASSFKSLSATLPFRLGNILSAEISRNKVVIKNIGPFDYNFKFKHYAYAVVAVRLHKGRTISIYDFKLNFKDKTYKCVALRAGDEAFDTKKWQFIKTNPKTIYSLLFIMNSDDLGNAKKKLPLTLIYSLIDSGQTNYKIPFKFINYDILTRTDKIPTNGIFVKPKSTPRKTVSNKSEK